MSLASNISSKPSIKLALKLAVIGILSFGFGAALFYKTNFFGKANGSGDDSAGSKPVTLDWATLRELDVATGKMGSKLGEANGKLVRVPGFMVPLEDKQNLVKEFLLVPSPQACVHTPPPPPNQMLHVKMASGRETNIAYGPIWLTGKMSVQDVEGPYGKSGFLITGVSTQPYTGD